MDDRRRSDPTDLPPESAEMTETEETSLPPLQDESAEPAPGTLASGCAVILAQARLAPLGPGVYRMMNATGDVLYVGKAKSLRKRLMSYTRPAGHVARIARMIAATASLELISTKTDSEALLLEANLIKQLRPRFNVLLRDDKSFPLILIATDHWAPQILKHRGARNRVGNYFGPFASASAVNRTLNALQRAFLLRSCSDGFFEGRTRACLLYQIKRCSGPCVGAISHAGYDRLVREATDFLSGKSRAVKEALAHQMEAAAEALDFETAAVFRDRLAALSAVQSQQGINPAGVDSADVFAIHQEGGMNCIEVFFFRTGQNWGNRAYYPRADRSLSPAEVLGSFLAQFYDDKPCPPLVLLSETVEDQALLAEALSSRGGSKVEVATPQRGEKRALVLHALANAREALGRKLAESSTQQRMLRGLQDLLGLAKTPRRIEVYDNSHIQGSNAVGAFVVAGPEGFEKGQYRKFNIRSTDLTPGDDYGMMREVLQRRFKRLVETPRVEAAAESEEGAADTEAAETEAAETVPAWPDILMIDGGLGQMHVAEAVLAEFGVRDVALVAVAKGEDRDAGRETLFQPGKPPLRLGPRDPALYFIQRLRDEAHRFAIGSHRQRRKKDLRESGLQDIAGIGPSRKRALLRHFGTLKQIENASVGDLQGVPGISAESAQRIYDYFHAPS